MVMNPDRQPLPFDHFTWFSLLHDKALSTHKPLLLHAYWDQAEVWMPLMRVGHGHYAALANWYSFTWQPVFSGAHCEVTKVALLRTLADLLIKQAHRLTLAPLPDENDNAALITQAFQEAGWIVRRTSCDINHVLFVEGRSFEEYWAMRPGPLRSTVKRKAKKGQVKIRIEREFSDESWAEYECVYAKSWKPAEGNPDFLRAFAIDTARHGGLRLGLAHVDGVPVAAQFWTSDQGTACIHKLAHDDAYIALSPGTLLSHALFQHAIDVDKVQMIDFGTGDDPYKRDWMESVRTRSRLELFRPQSPHNWPTLAKYAVKSALNRLAAARNSA